MFNCNTYSILESIPLSFPSLLFDFLVRF